MDTDLVLTIGIVLLVLSVPSLLSAWAESRAPRLGAILTLVSLGMILVALYEKPGGYSFNEVPGVIIDVVGRFIK